MNIAVIGLGKMGSQIARKLAEDGHAVVGYNRTPAAADALAQYGVKPARERQDVPRAFAGEAFAIWLMIPAEVVDQELSQWLSIAPRGTIVIDGGNSDFRNAPAREKTARDAGAQFLDVGTSGGVWGYQDGFSLMVGGDEDACRTIDPILKSLAAPSGSYARFGASGAGHYVKMVHNAVEYGMMESLAEGYRVLREGRYEGIDLESVANVWQKGSVVSSWLNGLAAGIFKKDPELSDVDGAVKESGEARWTLEIAKEKGIGMPAIQAAFDVRIATQRGEKNYATKFLAALRTAFGGHDLQGK